jgi:hypothetical protein
VYQAEVQGNKGRMQGNKGQVQRNKGRQGKILGMVWFIFELLDEGTL